MIERSNRYNGRKNSTVRKSECRVHASEQSPGGSTGAAAGRATAPTGHTRTGTRLVVDSLLRVQGEGGGVGQNPVT